MSLVLGRSNNIEVKTMYEWGSGRHCVMLGNADVSMDNAVQHLREVLRGENVSGDMALRSLFAYISSMRPQEREVRGVPVASVDYSYYAWLEPHPGVPLPVEAEGPTIEVLGESIDRRDFGAFLGYVMTNSRLDGPEDARIGLIHEIQAVVGT